MFTSAELMNQLARRVFILLMPVLAALPARTWAQANVLSVRDTGAVAGAADVVIPIDLTVDQDLTGAFSFDVSFDPNLCNQLSNPSGIVVRKGGRQTLDPAENPIVCSSGKITIAVFDLTGGTVIPQGSGEIFEIDLGGVTAAASGAFVLSPPATITGHHMTATVTVTGDPGTLTITTPTTTTIATSTTTSQALTTTTTSTTQAPTTTTTSSITTTTQQLPTTTTTSRPPTTAPNSIPTTTTTTLPCTTARCTLDAALTSPACAGQTIPASVIGKLDTAETLIDQAVTTPGKQGRRELKKAKTVLRQAGVKVMRAAKGKKATLSPACAAVLEEGIHSVRNGLTP